MVDFIKLRFLGESRIALKEQIYQLHNLPAEALIKRGITPLVQHHDGITYTINEYPIRTAIHDLDIRITELQAYIQNSLHHTYNIWKTNRKFNSNDFSYTLLVETLDYLESIIPAIKFGSITALEFGFNLQTNVSPTTIIKNNLLMQDVKGPGRAQSYRGGGFIKVFPKANYDIKAYDKGRQYNSSKIQSTNLLRFEIRFRSKELNGLEVSNLGDLKNKFLLRKMFLKLLNRFDELVIMDEINEKAIEDPDLSKLYRYTNPAYWNTIRNRQTKSRRKANFNMLLEKNSLLETKHSLKLELLRKYLYLINR